MMTVNSECLYINLGESVRPETVPYKKFSAGAIIGFKGQTIKELRETTGAKLNVFQGNIFYLWFLIIFSHFRGMSSLNRPYVYRPWSAKCCQ